MELTQKLIDLNTLLNQANSDDERAAKFGELLTELVANNETDLSALFIQMNVLNHYLTPEIKESIQLDDFVETYQKAKSVAPGIFNAIANGRENMNTVPWSEVIPKMFTDMTKEVTGKQLNAADRDAFNGFMESLYNAPQHALPPTDGYIHATHSAMSGSRPGKKPSIAVKVKVKVKFHWKEYDDYFWGGFAAGALGGFIVGFAVSSFLVAALAIPGGVILGLVVALFAWLGKAIHRAIQNKKINKLLANGDITLEEADSMREELYLGVAESSEPFKFLTPEELLDESGAMNPDGSEFSLNLSLATMMTAMLSNSRATDFMDFAN